MNTKSDTVVIDSVKYHDLLESQRLLDALECAGVDNWSGYEYAMELYQRQNEED